MALYAEAKDGGRWVSYSRAKTHYEAPERYRSPLYTYRKVRGSVDQLEALGLIDHQKALPGDRGWQSAMIARPELIRLVQKVTAGQLALAPLHEPIWLRDAERNLIDYRDTGLTERMRREVQAQNEALAATSFGEILPFPGRLRRIFNGDFQQGGRFYAEGGSWQTLSRSERLRISIDGEPTVEIDYSSFHPTLAYAECGLVPPIDAYDIPGEPRELVKIAFNILLNSSSRNGARHELAMKPLMSKELLGVEREDGETRDSFRTRLVQIDPTYFQRASRRADLLIEAILTRHAPIQSMFFTGAGLRLQRRDSDIAEGVMRRMRNQGIVVAPVHDSFLAPQSKADLLEEIMTDEAAGHGVAVTCKRSAS